jgi:hypothetical protein
MENFIQKLIAASAPSIAHGNSVLLVGEAMVVRAFQQSYTDTDVLGWKVVEVSGENIEPLLHVAEELVSFSPDVIVLCTDIYKDEILSVLNRIKWAVLPRYMVAGTAHQQKVEARVHRLTEHLPIQSFAIGYPGVKEHMYDILAAKRRSGAEGYVAELGVFEGGTLLFLKNVIKELGFKETKLVGFDTFDTFPKPTKLLDQFFMEEFTCKHGEATIQLLRSEGIEVVQGNIIDTYRWLEDTSLLLTFIDTDNYSSANVALPLVWENTQVGGAVVFDHYYTDEKYLTTIGERVAVWEFFKDRTDYINLSNTGVFIKVDY